MIVTYFQVLDENIILIFVHNLFGLSLDRKKCREEVMSSLAATPNTKTNMFRIMPYILIKTVFTLLEQLKCKLNLHSGAQKTCSCCMRFYSMCRSESITFWKEMTVLLRHLLRNEAIATLGTTSTFSIYLRYDMSSLSGYISWRVVTHNVLYARLPTYINGLQEESKSPNKRENSGSNWHQLCLT